MCICLFSRLGTSLGDVGDGADDGEGPLDL